MMGVVPDPLTSPKLTGVAPPQSATRLHLPRRRRLSPQGGAAGTLADWRPRGAGYRRGGCGGYGSTISRRPWSKVTLKWFSVANPMRYSSPSAMTNAGTGPGWSTNSTVPR